MTTETTPPAQTQTADVTSPIVTGDTPQPVVSSPIVEPTPATPDPVVDPVIDPAATPPVVPDPEADSKTTPEWAQKRINDLTAKRYAAERTATTERAARIAAEAKAVELLAQISGKPGDTPAPATQPMSEAEIERRANEKAVQLAHSARFNEACNNVAENGKKEYKDWDEVVKNLGLVGAIGSDVPSDFLELAIALKDPHKVLHHLGKNLEQAERIVKSDPRHMALEMARVEAQLAAPPAPPVLPPISNAPVPVIPVAGASKPGPKAVDDPNISVEEFMSLRAQQADDRRKRYQRV